MKPENRDKLEKYRRVYQGWVNDKTLDLKAHERDEIFQVIKEEFNPAYSYMEWCGHCVGQMVEYAFTELDKRPVDTINVKLK